MPLGQAAQKYDVPLALAAPVAAEAESACYDALPPTLLVRARARPCSPRTKLENRQHSCGERRAPLQLNCSSSLSPTAITVFDWVMSQRFPRKNHDQSEEK